MSTIKSSDEHLTLNADGTSKDIKLQSNASEKVIIKSDGKVGIGTSSPARLFAVSTGGTKTDANVKYVQNLAQSNESSNQASLGLYFKGASSAADRFFQLQPAEHGVANDGWIEVNPDGGKFRARNGIYFGTDTATANALDDYEEGTWTPVLTDLSNNATMHSLSTGSYTKIGRVVTVTGNVRTSSLNSVSGNLYISGLPYSCAAGNGFHAAGAIANAENFSITAGNSIAIYMSANSSNLRIDIYDSTVGVTVMQASEWTSDGQIAISVTYFAA